MTRQSPEPRSRQGVGRPGLYALSLIALCFCLATAQLHASAYYRWVDENGVTHYTSTPPQGIASEKVTSSSSGSSRAAESNAAPTTDDKNKAAVADETDPANFKDPERCAAAEKRVETLQNNSRIRMRSEDGELRFLTPEEIQETLEEAQQAIRESC